MEQFGDSNCAQESIEEMYAQLESYQNIYDARKAQKLNTIEIEKQILKQKDDILVEQKKLINSIISIKECENYFYTINYEQLYKNNFRTDVKKAVKFYLELYEDFKYDEENFCGFILYPQALNPFLKTMETMGESKNIMILPAYNQEEDHNSPAYLIIKLDGESKYVNCFRTNRV